MRVLLTLRRVSLLYNLKVLRCSFPPGSYDYLLEHDLEDKFDGRRGEIIETLVIGPDGATPRELETLEIVNLPCRPQPDLTGHASFLGLLRTLQTLMLRIDYPSSQEAPYRYSPLGDVSHEFFTRLPDTWLRPASTSLTSLSLGANELWGYLLKVDFRDVRFPRLKSLDMQRFVFSHDWQLGWILSHKSLQVLSLNQCQILAHACWYGEEDDDYPTKVLPTGNKSSLQEYHYAKSWHHYYEELSGGLENLGSYPQIANEPNGQYVEFHYDAWWPVTPDQRTQAEDKEKLNLFQATISSRSGN